MLTLPLSTRCPPALIVFARPTPTPSPPLHSALPYPSRVHTSSATTPSTPAPSSRSTSGTLPSSPTHLPCHPPPHQLAAGPGGPPRALLPAQRAPTSAFVPAVDTSAPGSWAARSRAVRPHASGSFLGAPREVPVLEALVDRGGGVAVRPVQQAVTALAGRATGASSRRRATAGAARDHIRYPRRARAARAGLPCRPRGARRAWRTCSCMTSWKACLLCGAWRSRPRPYTTARAANERIAAPGWRAVGKGMGASTSASPLRLVVSYVRNGGTRAVEALMALGAWDAVVAT
ncbi:hypothetical protein B0H10DRAFT_884304 [Mycena sp. CBHHK59/15]|nr:hypothetical protein B0H10DRAFT_884304 [Mycena sp. CBHHK59/15]